MSALIDPPPHPAGRAWRVRLGRRRRGQPTTSGWKQRSGARGPAGPAAGTRLAGRGPAHSAEWRARGVPPMHRPAGHVELNHGAPHGVGGGVTELGVEPGAMPEREPDAAVAAGNRAILAASARGDHSGRRSAGWGPEVGPYAGAASTAIG